MPILQPFCVVLFALAVTALGGYAAAEFFSHGQGRIRATAADRFDLIAWASKYGALLLGLTLLLWDSRYGFGDGLVQFGAGLFYLGVGGWQAMGGPRADARPEGSSPPTASLRVMAVGLLFCTGSLLRQDDGSLTRNGAARETGRRTQERTKSPRKNRYNGPTPLIVVDRPISAVGPISA
ncbi:MAG: hypothetical protein ACRC1K_12260 [Planctomycetia bacterium]